MVLTTPTKNANDKITNGQMRVVVFVGSVSGVRFNISLTKSTDLQSYILPATTPTVQAAK